MSENSLLQHVLSSSVASAPSPSSMPTPAPMTIPTNGSASAVEPLLSAEKGVSFQRRWTKEGVHPYDEVQWEIRRSVITDEKGTVVFEMDNIEVPTFWSQLATDILASKYIRKAGVPNDAGCETSLKEVLHRIAHTLRVEGEKRGGYFATPKDAEIFEMELTAIMLHQRAVFNSPVWFNLGLFHDYGILGSSGNYAWNFEKGKAVMMEHAYERPQCSACFIQSVNDDLMSIFDLVKQEARVFKYGSGTGTNFSKIRGWQEKLSGGGTSSGLMSFLEVFDKGAGATKSGGTTRRAAKMVCLDMDHPEIVGFINWKLKEEKKAHALIEAGYPTDFNGEAYKTVSGQNSNNSVRVTDEFMRAVETGSEWNTRLRTTGEVCETFQARDLMRQVAEAAWACADPGVQYDSTINHWNTCAGHDRITASNPCSEYMFLDNTACNLSSINLIKYLNEDGTFNIEDYRRTIDVMTTAQEIIVDASSYPTEAIAHNSHVYRTLGLGYANLGTLLMVMGVSYDSSEGRGIAAALTAIMTGRGYAQSARLAASKGPFPGYAPSNVASMQRVMVKHQAKAYEIPSDCPEELRKASREDWDLAVDLGKSNGYRNAQLTVLAPTGTIAFVMDCDTTGVEPDFALVKFKKLAGGGSFKIVNQSVSLALKRLGYAPEQVKDITTYMLGTQTLNGAPDINYKSLMAHGLTIDDLAKIDQSLKGAFDIEHVLNPGVLGEEAMMRLGVSPELVRDSSFRLLRHLGFTQTQIDRANEVVCGTMTIEGAPHLKSEHLAAFDCASKCGKKGQRFIEPMGHVRMMSAVQPFISGAISKTVNVPADTTPEQIAQIYLEGWKMGLKAISIYRDGSKWSQPLNTKSDQAKNAAAADRQVVARRKMPDERQSLTHKFNIGNHKGYITVGLYEDGTPGEIFIKMAKEGTVLSGLMDSFALAISLALQYGVPLNVLVNKFSHTHFEPYGMTSNPHIRIAKSTVDYIFRWLALKFLSSEERAMVGLNELVSSAAAPITPIISLSPVLEEDLMKTGHANVNGKTDLNGHSASFSGGSSEFQGSSIFSAYGDAQTCDTCGSMMLRNGTCYKCPNCGSTSGCS